MNSNRVWNTSLITLLALSALLQACGPEDDPTPPRDEFNYTITAEGFADVPATTTAADGHVSPVGSYKDAAGIQTEFVADEVILNDATDEQVADFLKRTGGAVVGSDEVPAVKSDRMRRTGVTPDQFKATARLVRLPQEKLPEESTLLANGRARGMDGAFKFHSSVAARLISLTARENAAGLRVSPNYLGTGDGTILWDPLESTCRHASLSIL